MNVRKSMSLVLYHTLTTSLPVSPGVCVCVFASSTSKHWNSHIPQSMYHRYKCVGFSATINFLNNMSMLFKSFRSLCSLSHTHTLARSLVKVHSLHFYCCTNIASLSSHSRLHIFSICLFGNGVGVFSYDFSLSRCISFFPNLFVGIVLPYIPILMSIPLSRHVKPIEW